MAGVSSSARIDMQIMGCSPRYTKLPTCGEDELTDGGGDGNRCRGTTGGGGGGAADDHCHLPKQSGSSPQRAITKLLIACVLTTIFMVCEVVGGYFANSIAIMSDAAHMFTDLTSFAVSLIAIYLSMRPASRKMNYGYHRAEVLGAVISVLMIWVITGVLVYAAIQRVIHMDFTVEADIMIIVAAIGVVMNIVLGAVFHYGSGGHGHSHGGLGGGHSHSHAPETDHRHTQISISSGSNNSLSDDVINSVATNNNSNGNTSNVQHDRSAGGCTATNTSVAASTGHSHSDAQPHHDSGNVNIRAAFIHVLGDLLQSIGVLIAAYIIRYYPEYKIADPICTFLFSLLVVITTIPILRDLGRVLMEGVPPGVDHTAMSAHLTALPGVRAVHSLHVWTLTVDKNACSVHLAIGPESDSDTVLRDAQRVIRSRHHIYHTTIQVERYNPRLMDNCHQCQPLL